MAGDDRTPVHNTGTFAVFADSAREWGEKCVEISKDTTREMKVRLIAAGLAVRLRADAAEFRRWIDEPDRRPDVVDRGPRVSAYQDLAGETIRFLAGLGDAKKRR